MKGKLYIFALFVLAVFSGCRKQAVPDEIPALPEDAPKMVISVKADTPEPKFTFLFWHKEDFDKGLESDDGSVVQPYHVSSPTGDIGDYMEPDASTNEPSGEKNDYNTGRVYPDSYGIAVCTGYGPYDGVTPAPAGTGKNYSALDVAVPGVTDVVVSQNVLEGSSIYPFSGNLEFFHPQIQLTVYATLASTMTKYIKDVSFSVGKDNLLSTLVWNASEKKYLPSAERPDAGWTSAKLAQQINSTDKKPIGTVYVVPLPSEGLEMKSMELVISGSIGNAADGAYSPFTMTVPAVFKDDAENELALVLNDSYEIYLIFDEDQIEITAVKVPWEEGGNILVPVHPIPATDSSGT